MLLKSVLRILVKLLALVNLIGYNSSAKNLLKTEATSGHLLKIILNTNQWSLVTFSRIIVLQVICQADLDTLFSNG